ncbi:MAG: LEA type 2 family protein [Thermoanaerobaculia bacterium]
MARLLLLLALAASAAAPIGLSVRPEAGDTFTAVVTGEAPGEASGPFSGTLALNGSAAELPVRGEAGRAGRRLNLPLTVRYADVPADWAERFRPSDFDYRLRGTVAGRERVEWAGSMRWAEVSVEVEKESVERFVRLGSLELTRLSLLASEARATVFVRNPFSFPLRVASARYELFANGRAVGSGETRGLLLHPGRENTLGFPIEVEHGPLLSAAGSALASGGQIDGRLLGQLTVRLPGGDIAAPLDLSGRLSLLAQ